MRNLATDSLYSLFSQGLATVSGLLVSVLVAKELGPDGLGRYATVVLFVSTVGFLINPGLYAAANYYLSSRKLTHQAVFRLALWLSIPVTTVGALVIAFLPSELLVGQGDAPTLAVRLAIAAATAFSVLGMTMNGVAFGAGRVKLVSGSLAVAALLHGVVIVALWESGELTYTSSVLVYCAVQTLNGITRMLLAVPAKSDGPQPGRKEVLPFLRYGLAVYSGRVLTFFSQRVDTYLVLFLAGQTALGYYSIAATLAGQIRLIPNAVGMSMMPNIGALTREASAQIVSRTSQVMLLVMIAAGTILAVAGPVIIPIVYGAEFDRSVAPFMIMLPGIIAIGSYLIAEPYFQTGGKPLIPVWLSLAGAVANAALCALLIPDYGILGASISYTISYGLQLFLTCLSFAKQSGLPWYTLLDLRRGVSGSVEVARAALRLPSASATIDM